MPSAGLVPSRQICGHPRSRPANGSPARSPSLGRRLFTVNLVPSPGRCDPRPTGPRTRRRGQMSPGSPGTSWPRGSVPEYLVLCRKLLTGPLGWTVQYQVSGVRSTRLRSRVPRSQPTLALIKTSGDALSVWKTIIGSVFSYFLFPREMHDRKAKAGLNRELV